MLPEELHQETYEAKRVLPDILHPVKRHKQEKVQHAICRSLKDTFQRRHTSRASEERPQRNSDQLFINKFNSGRVVADRDYGLSFREIGSRVGRNQATVMRICDR
ncbi:hypothetical protein TNCV_3641011 [Trichonephila clavipes]|nr:hypothetical protein TNCV_3641011 [Trichonephila clavipes]